jgi:polyferredoxin
MADLELERVRKLTRILDHYMVDPLLGFVLPGAGDLIGSLFGLYVVAIAVRRRVSPIIVARMLLNLAIDAGIGVVPVLGDIADIAFKANDRNLRLLLDRRDTGKPTARDWLAVAGALAAFAAVIGLAIWAMIALVHAVHW